MEHTTSTSITIKKKQFDFTESLEKKKKGNLLKNLNNRVEINK